MDPTALKAHRAWSDYMCRKREVAIITDNLKLQMHFATMTTFIFHS